MIFPNAHTLCSRTCSCGDDNKRTNFGTAPGYVKCEKFGSNINLDIHSDFVVKIEPTFQPVFNIILIVRRPKFKPLVTTSLVWSEFPDAMFVRAQVASNCRAAFSSSSKHSTSMGTIPARISSSIGGLFPLDNSFL